MKTIAVVGTMDTKGIEHAYLVSCIRDLGYETLVIDVGSYEPTSIKPDVTRSQILTAASATEDAGGIESPRSKAGNSPNDSPATDRGAAIASMANALPAYVRQLANAHRIQGIISLGGTGGTAMGTAAMRALPMSFPKVMVTTVAGGDVSRYVDISDILMFPSIVDVSGLNRISRGVFRRAAACVVAMAEANSQSENPQELKPLIVASMFGNTTRCVDHAKQLLETAGYEVLVFHATGVGGRTMEAIIETGAVAGVLDVTTTEWADELVGGILRGGSKRLEAAALKGVPAVIAPGCLDMVNFGEPASIPTKFHGRTFYQHNPQITLMRTTPEECTQLGGLIASKLNQSIGEVRFLFPRKAISVISAEGQPFHDPIADHALLTSLQSSLRKDIPFEVMDCGINDPIFAEACVRSLLDAMALANRA